MTHPRTHLAAQPWLLPGPLGVQGTALSPAMGSRGKVRGTDPGPCWEPCGCSQQSRVSPELCLLAMCLDAEVPCPLAGTGSARRTSFCTDRASARCPRLTWPPATSARPSCCTPRSPPACASPSPTPRRPTGLMPSPSECPATGGLVWRGTARPALVTDWGRVTCGTFFMIGLNIPFGALWEL